MGYEGEATQVRAQRVQTFGVYTVVGDATAFDTDDAGGVVARALAEAGAPAPNEVMVHRVERPSSDESSSWLDELLVDAPEPTPSTSSPQPPVAVVFHQETGPHVSRYITIVVSG